MANLSEFTAEAPVWVSGRTYAVGQVVRDPADWYFRYVRVAGGAGTTNPINDPGSWRPDGARPIRSIQRGVVAVNATTKDVAISAVNTAKTELRLLGIRGGPSYAISQQWAVNLQLFNSTTLRFTVGDADTGGSTVASWELTEYY